MILPSSEFTDILIQIANYDTSADPNNWSKDNPLWGHCAVVALLAQDIFGGEIYRGSLKHIPKYSYLRSHFWNNIDGQMIDFTNSQYTDLSYKDLQPELRTRTDILSYPNTVARYETLKERYTKLKNIESID